MIDLLVAGGGPTGLSTAIAAAQAGLSVRVVDPRHGIIDKACGEGLMPSTVRLLADLGVHPAVSHPFEGIRYVVGDAHADGHFPGGPGLGVRRTVLHAALGARADALGIDREVGRIKDPVVHADHVQVGPHRARWLVVADGLRSPLRHQLGLDRATRWPDRFGVRRHFHTRPWSPFVEVYWADDAEAYVTPVADDLVGVAFLFGTKARARDAHQPGRPFDRLLARFPQLAARLGEPATVARGAGPFAAAASQRVLGRILLAGDAAGYLDPLTGEGVKLGVSSAVAAVDAIVANDPQSYEAAWRRLYRPYAVATGSLLVLTRPTWVRRAMVPVLRTLPVVFDKVLQHLADGPIPAGATLTTTEVL